MANSVSDFCAKVNAQVGASGALFKCVPNADGESCTISRAPNAQSPFVPYLTRVVYIVVDDKVIVGDGAGQAASPAGAYISGLN